MTVSPYMSGLGVDPALSRNSTADAALVKAKAGMNAKQMEKIDEAAKEFESVFIAEMLSNMFESVDVDPMFGGGESEETWRGMMIEEYGKQIVRSGGVGLADSIKAKMIEMQEQMQ